MIWIFAKKYRGEKVINAAKKRIRAAWKKEQARRKKEGESLLAEKNFKAAIIEAGLQHFERVDSTTT